MEDFKVTDFIPELDLDQDEISAMAGILYHPGFKAYQKIWKHVVSTFAVATLNTEQHDKEKVLARHNAAKVAAQLFAGVTAKVNQEVEDFIASRPSDKPINVTENLDLESPLYYVEDGEEPPFV